MVDQANVSQEVIDAFSAISAGDKRWAIAKVEDSQVVLEALGDKTDDCPADIAAMAAATGDEPRYIVFDFEAKKKDGSGLKKIVFIAYSPDSCSSMQLKFALQNFKASCKSKINAHKEMQVNDKRDLKESEFRDLFDI